MIKKYKNQQGIGLRIKILFLILPILISAIFISNTISRKIFYDSLTCSGQDFALYKATQLEKYASSQWEVLVQNDFFKQKIYRDAAISSISNYISDISNSKEELILAVDENNNIVISSTEDTPDVPDISVLRNSFEEKHSGWLTIYLYEENWVGYTFHFVPFNLQFFLIEKETHFYNEIQRITFIENIIIIILVLITIFLISISVRYLLHPLEKVTKAIKYISTTGKMDKIIEVEFPDEIGELAFEFNIMTSTLNNIYGRLRDTALSEAIASKQISMREMETLNILSSAADYKDPETGSHTQRVGEYARLLARAMNRDEKTQHLLLNTAPLHDIGKLGIPDVILLKTKRLTKDEFNIIKTHTRIGYNILKQSHSIFLREGAEIALTHHERWDGKGYPQGLKGENIPIDGRIVCVVDVFDALVSTRPYKKAWSFEKTAALLESEKEKQFDPVIVDLFLEHFDEVLSIFKNSQKELIVLPSA